MWSYEVATGKLRRDYVFVGIGYSGHERSINVPGDERIPNKGPIPRGRYAIGEFFDDPGGKGPIVCHLTPIEETDTFGRDGFMIHGDNAQGNHSASHGCIILGRVYREQIRDSADNGLGVI